MMVTFGQTARSQVLRVRVWDRQTYGCDVQLEGHTDRLIFIWGRHVISLCHQLPALLDSNVRVLVNRTGTRVRRDRVRVSNQDGKHYCMDDGCFDDFTMDYWNCSDIPTFLCNVNYKQGSLSW